MRKSLIFIIAILASVHIADGQIVGPKIVCQNTFATFDLPNAGNSTSVTWNIPSSVPVTTNMKTRSVTVQFTDTGFITLSATYSKKTYNYTVHVVYCPSTDCAGTKASSPFLFEDFGTLPNGTARTPLPPGYTTYKYLSSGAIDDGQYIVSDSVNNGRPEWVKMTDHTGNLYGGMMLVNASFQPDTFYTRVITGLCQGAQYSFSAWLLNANGKEVLQSDKICSGKYIYPNLAFVVLDARTGTELGRVNTNDVSMKLVTNGSGQIVDDPTWQRYGFGFRTPPGVDSVKLIMYNIAPGGCGNDIAIDDIEFTYCGPTLIAYLHNSDQSNDTICSGNPDTIFASVTPGYFSHPTYQWQVSLDGVNWTNIAGATDSVYIIPSTDTSDTRYYRFLAAEQGQIGYSTCNSPSNMVHLLVLRSPVVHPGDTTICAGGTATLRAQEGYTSYLWSTGATTSSIMVSPPTTTKYYVTASLSSGAAGTCTATDSSLVTVFDPSSVNLGADTNLCVGNTLTLSPFHGYTPSGLTYLWSTGDTTPSIQVTTSGSYWVKVFSPACGEIDDTIQVNFHNPPIVNLGNDTAICQGQSLTLNAGNAGSTYLWNTGATTQQIPTDTAGIYWVKVTSPYGCSASDTLQLTVNPSPIVNLGPDIAICQGQNFTLDAGNPGGSYLWNTGDTSEMITINTGGTYWARVTNTYGCAAADTIQIALNPPASCPSGGCFPVYFQSFGEAAQPSDTTLMPPIPDSISRGFQGTPLTYYAANPFCPPQGTYALRYLSGRCDGKWVSDLDHTPGDTNGYMLIVNPQKQHDMLYRDTIKGTCASYTYTFSLWVANLFKSNGTKPNLILSIIDPITNTIIQQYKTGPIDNTLSLDGIHLNWQQVSMRFQIPSATNAFIFEIDNNGPSSAIGNDFAIDDISLEICKPIPQIMLNGQVKDTVQLCANSKAQFTSQLFPDTLRAAIYQWQFSTDKINWTNIPGANGKTYTIDSVRPSHSGYYRLLVSEPWNAGDPDCALFSNLIYLQVNPLPIVNLGPDTAICQGESLTLNAGNSGASYLWNTGATTQQITVNTTGTYWVNVTNSYGCSAADTMQLTVNPLPIVNLGPDTAICQGESLTLNAGNSGASYLWSTGATTQTLAVNATDTYWVRVTNGFGCSAADTLQLTVNPLPTVNLGPDTAICQGESLMLNAGNSGATYLWSTGATTQTLAVNATGTYWVKVTNGFGCSAADTLQLTVNPLPTVNLGPDTAICQGESLMLDAGNSGASYLWSTGATTQTLAVNTTGTYWVRVTNGFGCSASDTLQLTVNPLPIVNLGPDTAICQGESLMLNAGNSGATYLWSIGATTQTISVNATGTYWVKVTNGYGCSAADTMQLTVNPLPTVNLGPDTAICQGESLMLNAGNSGASYLWSSGATTQTLAVNTTGTYWVRVTNGFGCSASDTLQLTVNPLPIVNLGPDTAICQGESLMLNAGNSGATYLWSTGATTQQININTAGTYSVKVTNGFGCSAADTMQLTVNPLPIVNLGPDTAICQGESLMLNAGNSGATYLWSTGATTQQININTAGTYWVRVTNGFGCSAADTLQLTVNPLPIVNLGPDTAICQGESLMLNAGNSGATYLWSIGATTQTISVNATGTYWVKVTNGYGCSAADTMQLTVNPLPIVNLGPDTAICQGESLTLNAGNSGASYLWNTGATTQQITVNTTGTYWVNVTNGYGCSAADTMQLTVNPLPTVNLGPDTAICQGESLMLDAGNSGASYLWSTGATTQTLAVNATGTYWVRVTNGFGCLAADTTRLQIHPLPVIQVSGDTAVCQGTWITLWVQETLRSRENNPQPSSLLWSTGVQDDSIRVQVNQDVAYWIRVTNTRGCSQSDTIHLKALPLPNLRLAHDTSACQGQPITLDAGGDGIQYRWSTGDTSRQITLKPSEADDDNVYRVEVINRFGCSAKDSVRLRVHPLPQLSLARQVNMCEGQRITLHASSLTGENYTYQWNDQSRADSLNVSRPGTYWVISSNGFCLRIDTVEVSLLSNTLPRLNPEAVLCPNTSLVLDVSSPDAIAYMWSTGATTPAITIDTPGTYTVLINGAVCNYTRLDTVRVKQGFLPGVRILADDSLICSGDRLLLRAIGDHAEGYRWQDGTYGPSYTATTAGLYRVQAFNICGIATDSIMLQPAADCVGDIIMPNAFTPNNDGHNDVFRPKVLHQVFDFELRIFNRWGQLLFVTHDWTQGWDGTFHGQPCDSGGYAWWVKYRETPGGPVMFKKGVLTLLR